MISLRLDASPRWVAVGFVAGAFLAAALSWPPASTPPPKKLVVVVKGEKTVTIEKPEMRLRELADELTKQTGRKFTLDAKYEADNTPYAILLNETPLSHVLDSSAYATKAKWDRRGTTYLLRPPTATEMATDPNLIGAAVDRLYDYFTTIPDDGGNLPDSVLRSLGDFRREMQQQQTIFPPFPDDSMNGWTMNTSQNGLGLNYKAGQTNGETTTERWQSRSWGWSNVKKPIWKVGK